MRKLSFLTGSTFSSTSLGLLELKQRTLTGKLIPMLFLHVRSKNESFSKLERKFNKVGMTIL